MKKYKLLGATLLSAVLCSLSPVDAALVPQNPDRRIGDSQPGFISQGNGDSGLQEMASKKAKKKVTKKKKGKAS